MALDARTYSISAREILAYVFLPRVFVRLREFSPNTSLFASLMAQIFLNTGLLPHGHPYTLASNDGRFGIRQVLGAAATNLKGGWRHVDQYIVYGAFILGLLLLVLQFVALFLMLVTQSAQAAAPFLSMFITSDPYDDVAFMMLDKVFQIPGFFGSRLDPGSAANISPFAQAMQALFRFYSGGILIIAFFIVLYYVFALAMETMQTGKPFGRRFPSIYGPMRLVFAVLLLLPLSYGYNTGQYITLLMARWGSSFATNSWLTFNNYLAAASMTNPMGLSPSEIVAKPRVQQINSLVNFFYLAHTCREGYRIAYGSSKGAIEPYFVVPANVKSPSSSTLVTPSSSYSTAKSLFKSGDVIITFGEKNAKYKKYPGQVKPYCGAVTIPTQSENVSKVRDVYDAYFQYIMGLWADPDLKKYGENTAYIVRFMDRLPTGYSFASPSVSWDATLSSTDSRPAGHKFYSTMRVNMQAIFNASIDSAIASMRATSIADMHMSSAILDLGWGGAGIWYNKIAEFNGALADAVFMIPVPIEYPMIMKHIEATKMTLESSINPKERYSLSTSSGDGVSLERYFSGSNLDDSAIDAELAYLFDTVYQTVADDQITARPKSAPVANNPIRNMFMYIYEETGLMNVRDNYGVSPLAKLSMLGKTIIDKTIFTLGAGTLASGFGGLLSGAGAEELGAAFEQGGGVLLGFASTGLIVGFVLFYLLPFFPFLYFFLAVGTWVKSIFEAMVAIPLLALAHLRLDGEGVGNAASKGYFLILEIFLRPVFIVFGLLAGITTFSALAAVLDGIFDLVVWNVAGYDMTMLASGSPSPAGDFLASFKDGVDGFLYTIFYTILIYMMAMASFKLIDGIPSKVMRFLQPVPTFHEMGGDPAENLIRNTTVGAHMLTGQLGGSVGNFAKEAGRSAGGVYKQTAAKMEGPGD